MKFEVIVMGGGLAGLTLALQLRGQGVQVAVVEAHSFPVPEAAHKVGESTVEIGAHYLAETIGLRDYLLKNHMIKGGLRYFFSDSGREDITRRVELGTTKFPQIDSFQLDRGKLENHLYDVCVKENIPVFCKSRLKNLSFSKPCSGELHSPDMPMKKVTADWIVDATGRRSVLKSKLGNTKPVASPNHSSWFRISRKVDVGSWSAEEPWHSRVESKLRWASTNHLMGEGYWVWLIPLGPSMTSVGVVADLNLHSSKSLSSLESTLTWLQQKEPECAKHLLPHKDEVLDFHYLCNYSCNANPLFSMDGWALTGEAGAFLDPFYSPGSDFIAMSNSIITQIITSARKDQLNAKHLKLYNFIYQQLFEAFWVLYENQYAHMGSGAVMVPKVIWDISVYWAGAAKYFITGDFASLETLPKAGYILSEYGRRNQMMQQFFQTPELKDPSRIDMEFVDFYKLPRIIALNDALLAPKDPYGVLDVLEKNLQLMDEIQEVVTTHKSLSDFVGRLGYSG